MSEPLSTLPKSNELPEILAENWLLYADVARITGLSHWTVEELARDDIFERSAQRWRRKVLVSRDSVERYLREFS